MTPTPDERAPEAGDTQPITAGLGDTQPLSRTAPLPVAPGPYGGAPAAGAPVPRYDAPAAPAYGTPPYGAQPPYGGQPPYGAQPPYGPAAYGAYGQPYGAAPLPPTDGLAVASLVTSVAGLVLLAGATGPIGIGLGIGGLARIRRTGARGRGMAIAGIVVGAVGTVVLGLIVSILVALVQWGASTAEQASGVLGGQDLDQLLEELEGSGSGSTPGDLDELLRELDEQLGHLDEGSLDVLPPYALPQDVAVGTCWERVPELYDLSDGVAVPCSQEHQAEVVALLTATGAPATDLSVEDPVLAAAYAACDAAVAAIDPGLVAWGVTDVWLPHPDQVAAGELVGYCVHQDTFGRSDSLTAPSGMSS
ncbi:DUF4190 domain-containing protein [Cellulomonas dongxiuzhuiae]|uniref:DUF4190 domain-containing protein n=1 Tax=Cellulomonas dongxiuzhuiae TaxID=2819979 RepID=UPI001AAFDC0C|nr:DUF4190 domain-containing protein [Cellulomonas dongxiuzhuiae]MBO3089883.1 DUF4190 domain-containing protein [Cellulomonas dongxiuzhuiae]